MVHGSGFLSSPPTITKLIFNILDNCLLILSQLVPEHCVFTNPKKRQPVQCSFTSTILETCSVSSVLQSCALGLSFFLGSFPLPCRRDWIYPVFKKKKDSRTKNNSCLFPSFHALSFCFLIEKIMITFFSSLTCFPNKSAPDPTSLWILLQIKMLMM